MMMDHGGITTSGSYRKFYESNGKKSLILLTHLQVTPHRMN